MGLISKTHFFSHLCCKKHSHFSLLWYFSFCGQFLTELDALPPVQSEWCGKAMVCPWVTSSLNSSCLSCLGWGRSMALFWWEIDLLFTLCLYNPGLLNTAGGKQEKLPGAANPAHVEIVFLHTILGGRPFDARSRGNLNYKCSELSFFFFSFPPHPLLTFSC